jgi:hypothetical protein
MPARRAASAYPAADGLRGAKTKEDNMRKSASVVAVCCVALSGVAATSAAAPSSFPTEIQVLGANGTDDGFYISGVFESNKAKCESNRDFKVFSKLAPMKHAKRGDTVTLDTGTGSDNGAWAGEITQKGGGQLKVKVFEKKLGNGDICEADSTNVKL